MLLSPQDFSPQGLLASPECAFWWKASGTGLLCLLFREAWLVSSPTPSPELCLTHCISCSTGTLLLSLHHRDFLKSTASRLVTDKLYLPFWNGCRSWWRLTICWGPNMPQGETVNTVLCSGSFSPVPAEDHKPVRDHFPWVLTVNQTDVLN